MYTLIIILGLFSAFIQPGFGFPSASDGNVYRSSNSDPTTFNSSLLLLLADPIVEIVGGVDAEPHEFPFLVSIQIDDEHACGGSIIDAPILEWVLTAAHCSQAPIGEYSVVAGAYKLSAPTKDEQTRSVIQINVHPSYNRKTKANDVAMFKVSPPFILSPPSVECISLVPKRLGGYHYFRDFRDHPVTRGRPPPRALVAGWGTLSSGGPAADTLQKVWVDHVQDAKCVAEYSVRNRTIDPREQVCYAAPGKDSCQGDSGGPLFVFEDGYGHALLPYQYGIVSFGRGCANPNFAGVYARVPAYVDWIYSHVYTCSKKR